MCNANIASRNLVRIAQIKFADLGHCFKAWSQHQHWTMCVTEEFWLLGDKEKTLGVQVSPLCDRDADNNIPKSQGGFFQFVCVPFYEAVADLVAPKATFLEQMRSNRDRWKSMLTEQEAKQEEPVSGSDAARSQGSGSCPVACIEADSLSESIGPDVKEAPAP